MKIASIVEATTVNAVAKVTLDFFRTGRELSQANPNVPKTEGILITFDRASAGSPNEFVLATKNAGLEIEIIPERARFDLSVIAALTGIIEKRRPDIIITNSVKSHFVMWRSRLWQQYSWVAYHHGYTSTDRKMRLYNRFDRWSLPKADLVITVCEAFAQELATVNRIPPERIRVQHNSIRSWTTPDPAQVQSMRDRFAIAPEERVILSIGRLSKEKAHADLFAAFQRLCEDDSGANYKLVLVGDGPERANLEASARSSRCANRITFTGQLSNVHPLYALAEVFVLPSHSEGSPNVLLEAMAARVPIVATAVGGVPEIVANEKSALLVPANKPQALAAAISHLLHNAELVRLLTDNAAIQIEQNHSPERRFRSLCDIYEDVIRQKASRG